MAQGTPSKNAPGRLAAWLPVGTQRGADWMLVRWSCLCLAVLLTVVAMMAVGLGNLLELEQIRLLCGHPFYMEAEAAQVTLLGPAGLFGLCVAVTMYLALVMLRVRAWSGRLQVALLALLATGLPGILCVLWGGVLPVAAPMACVLLLWLLVTVVPFFRPGRP